MPGFRRAFRPLTRRERCESTPLPGESGRFSALDELPGDWWSLAENEPGGYQYRTVVQVLGRRVECMLDGVLGRTMSPRSSCSACLTVRPSSA